MKKRIVWALAAVCLCVSLLLTGCGGAGKTPSTAATTKGGTADTTAAGDTTAGDDTGTTAGDTTGDATDPSGDTPADTTANNNKTTPSKATTAQPTAKPTTGSTGVIDIIDKYTTDNLPKKDLNKFVLKVATTDKQLIKNLGDDKPGSIPLKRYDVLAEIEKRFNCTVQPVYYEYGKTAERYSAMILSGASASVPHVILTTTWEAGNLIGANLLTTFDQLKYVDTKAPWWNESMATAGKVKGKNYLMTNELCRVSTRAWGVAYNKAIAKEIGLTEATLSSLVKNKQWTWDKFEEYAKKAVKDLNGDGKFDDKDRWGFSSPRTDFIYAMMAAADIDYIETVGGKLTYGLGSDKAITALEKLNQITSGGSIRYPVENNTDQHNAFPDGKTLFFVYTYGGMLNNIRENGDMGLLPMPLGPGVTEYRSLVDHNSPVVMIPKTNKNLEQTGLLLEAMAFAYWKNLPWMVDEYTDLYLDEGDALSAATLTAMFDRAVITPSQYMDTAAFLKACKVPILDAMSTPNEDISGVVASIKNASQAVIDSFFGQ